MESKKYKNAARCFMMCSMEHCKFSDVSSNIVNDLCIFSVIEFSVGDPTPTRTLSFNNEIKIFIIER